ncbi:efflux RND transporter periplasmic adaptor subunit [Rhodospirillales bacterium]|nr:efflux RND transporter periplasmic adaptor subunit [Rhodospirillales bacterium]
MKTLVFRFLIMGGLCLWSFGAPIAQEKNGPPPAAAVGLDAVIVEPLNQTVAVIGRFVPRQSGDVAARISAPVEEYLVQVGDRVEKGDVLAMLVKDTFEWERNRQRAEVQSTRAQLQTDRDTLLLLEQELKRLDRLRKSPAFSEARYADKAQEVARAKSEISRAQAQIKSAEATLALADLDLTYTKVIAPYPGAIIRRHTEAGSYVRVGDPLVSLLDYTNLEIEADVTANRIGGLSPGRQLNASFENGQSLMATVRAVIPDENPRTRTRRVRFIPTFIDDASSSAANQTVTVRVPVGEIRDVVTVHKDAVLNRRGAQIVIINEDGKAAFRTVQLGESVGPRFVVLEGLTTGEHVVVRGNERIRPGQAIVDQDDKTSPPS